MDRGAWQATVRGVAKSRTWLNDWAHTQSSHEAFTMKPKKEQSPGNSIQEARAQASILNKGEILLMARVLLILYPVDSTEYFKNK